MDSQRIPLFKATVSDKPKQPQFLPPASNVPSNGLFSAQSTPQGDRRHVAPASNSLFAGATPGAKLSSKRGGAGLFGAGSGKPPSFSFSPVGSSNGESSLFSPGAFASPPKATRPTAALGRYTSPLSDDESYIDKGSPRIFEDDSRGDPAPQEEDDDTGMFGDEEDFTEDDTIQDSPERADGLSHFREEIGTAVKEPSALIIRTDDLMEELSKTMSPAAYEDDEFDYDDDMDMDRRLPVSSEEQQEKLTGISKVFLQTLHDNLPKSKADSDLHRAYYIASLVLPMYHSTANATEVLRKWLFYHHPNPSPLQLTTLRGMHPNSAFAFNFWDIVIRLILRGELQEAIEVLRGANWDMRSQDAPATTKPAFGAQKVLEERFSRSEIASIKQAVSTLINLLTRCPGRGRSSYQPPLNFFPSANLSLDSPGSPKDWRIWRLEVETALEDVKGFVDDTEGEGHYYGVFQPRAKVPKEARRPLLRIYEIMRGSSGEGGTHDTILSESEIWQEAVVGLMMWTREVNSPQAFEEDQFEESYEGYELQHLSQGQYHSLVNHRRQLQLAQLASVMETIADNRPINPTDSLEITAGGAMAFDPSFIDQLAKYSPLVGAAVVEIGGWGGWVKRETTPKEPTDGGTMGFLDEEDLAVLETGAEEVDLPAKAAEDLLRQYASSLFGTTWVNEDAEIEGWQIGMNVLKRTKDGKELASSLLTQLPLTSTPRVEKLLKHTTEQGLEQTASDIAFNWATHLQSNTQNYGDILHFLALAASFNADARKKLHEITTFLLEQSLLSSGPFPAKNETDPRLQHLLSSPSECASEILRFEISGYAALRTFYALRESAPGTAVKALTAVIRAAGEPIDGGVWDKEWESPVEPTVLPAVLRELLTCADAIGVTEALDVCKVLTDWEACGESLRKASVEVGPEGSWVDLGNQGDVVKRVRQRLCGVLARGWLKSGE